MFDVTLPTKNFLQNQIFYTIFPSSKHFHRHQICCSNFLTLKTFYSTKFFVLFFHSVGITTGQAGQSFQGRCTAMLANLKKNEKKTKKKNQTEFTLLMNLLLPKSFLRYVPKGTFANIFRKLVRHF